MSLRVPSPVLNSCCHVEPTLQTPWYGWTFLRELWLYNAGPLLERLSLIVWISTMKLVSKHLQIILLLLLFIIFKHIIFDDILIFADCVRCSFGHGHGRPQARISARISSRTQKWGWSQSLVCLLWISICLSLRVLRLSLLSCRWQEICRSRTRQWPHARTQTQCCP